MRYVTKNSLFFFFAVATFYGVVSGCSQIKRNTPVLTAPEAETEQAPPPAAVVPPKYLYIASGLCYGGDATANAVSAGSNTITRYNLNSGSFDSVVFDYNALGSGDQPASILDHGADELLVLIENTGSRRVDRLDKKTGEIQNYLTNSNLAAVMRHLTQLADGSFLISKSSAIEKFNENKSRITSGASPFINAPAGQCATSTTLISGVTELPSGFIAYTHASTTPKNRWGVIKSTGYASAVDCLSGITMATTTALPTALIAADGTNDVLVASGSSTSASNFIYSYQVDPTTGLISNPNPAFTDFSYISAPSAMIQDTSTGDIYVASARAYLNSIEKMSYDSTTRTLTRVSPTFIGNSIYTRCVSGMAIGN